MLIEDYTRNATLVRVVDGDTIEVNIDLGFRIWKKERIRVIGVNCPKMKGDTKVLGNAAKNATELWFSHVGDFVIQTHIDKTDSFGRILASVRSKRIGQSASGMLSSQEDLGAYLLINGFAVPY